MICSIINTENCWSSDILTPSAIRQCSPLLSVFSRTKFLKAVMFSGRVMSPSPSTPPSPENHSGHPHWNGYCLRQFLFLCECAALIHTIIRFKKFTRCCIEIFQFEVTGSFQRHTKAFSMPAPPPQNVLWKASRSSTDIAEVQKLTFTVFCQGFLQKTNLNQLTFMDASCYSDSPLVNPLGWWTCCQSSGQCWPFS